MQPDTGNPQGAFKRILGNLGFYAGGFAALLGRIVAILLLLVLGAFSLAFFSWLGWWNAAILPGLPSLFYLFYKRKLLRMAFSSRQQEALSINDRAYLCLALFVIMLGCAVTAIGTRGDIFACLLASTATLLYTQAQCRYWESQQKTEHFLYHLLKASTAMLVIVSASLLAYAVFVARVQILSSAAPLEQIRGWEERIANAHEYVEKHTPSSGVILAVMAALYLARFLEIRYWPASHIASWAGTGARFANTWITRIGLAFLVPASFTLLATGEQESGPRATLQASIRDMQHEYDELRSETVAAMAYQAEWGLVESQWSHTPEEQRKLLGESVRLDKKSSDLQEAIQSAKAEKEPEKEGAEAEASEGSIKLPASALENATEKPLDAALPPDSVAESALENLSPRDLHKQLVVAQRASNDAKDGNARLKNEMGDDLFDSVKDFVSEQVRLPHSTSVALSALTSSYPILKEFLDPVQDAIKETFLPSIRSAASATIRNALNAHGRPFTDFLKPASLTLANAAIAKLKPPQVSAIDEAEIIVQEQTRVNSQQAELVSLVGSERAKNLETTSRNERENPEHSERQGRPENLPEERATPRPEFHPAVP